MFFLILVSRLALAADLTNATVSVVVQDEAGNPIDLGWVDDMSTVSYTYDHVVDSTCHVVGYLNRTGIKTCVSDVLVNRTKIDGHVSVQSTRVNSQSTQTFEFDTHHTTLFYMSALPGTRSVQFPEGIYAPGSGDLSPVNATETWEFAPGKVYVLTLRTSSKVRFADPVSSGGTYELVQGDRVTQVENGAFIRPGSYVIQWTEGWRAMASRPECEIVFDATVPKGIPAAVIMQGIPAESRRCAPHERIRAVLNAERQLTWQKVRDADADATSPGSGVYANGKEVRQGDTVTVEPAKDFSLEIRTTLASGM